MTPAVLILTDGMADEPLPELDGLTPLEHAPTPHMDAIARAGACGTFLSLPANVPTSSDVANMSVMGYDVESYICGRGPLEALGRDIALGPDDVAFRCNFIRAEGGVLEDYSAGHISDADARELIAALKEVFDSPKVTFHSGVSYRNLMILHGEEFTDQVHYVKADAAQGMALDEIMLRPADDSVAAAATAAFVNDLTRRTRELLAGHPVNARRNSPANMVWPFSPGRQPALLPFEQKYGATGAIISAVDVIFGLGRAVGMDVIRVPGATGFVDTDYEAKAAAAAAAVDRYDLVYLHVEAADECGHLGDLELKLRAIRDIDQRLVGTLRTLLAGRDVTYAVLPDHPVPLHKRVHTREPVPFAVYGPHVTSDSCQVYSEREALRGAYGLIRGEQLMRLVLNRPGITGDGGNDDGQ